MSHDKNFSSDQSSYETIPSSQPEGVTYVVPNGGANPILAQAKQVPPSNITVVIGQPTSSGIQYPELSLLPSAKVNGQWNYGIFDRCCTCDGTCWNAWLCSCFPIAQAVHKMSQSGNSVCGWTYWTVLGVFLFLLVINLIMTMLGFSSPNMHNIWLFIVLCQLRQAVRVFYDIDGHCCTDCLATLFCSPCSLTQLVGQLWSNPEHVPGCDFSEKPAHIV